MPRSATTCPTPSASRNHADEDGYFVHARRSRAATRSTAVRHQLQRRRPAVEAEGVVLLQLPPQRPVQVHAGHRRARALEADQQLHLQGHLPAQSQQPVHRLLQQAREAAGAARPRLRSCRCRPRAIRPRATTRGRASGRASSAAARSSTCSPATGTTSSRSIRPTSTASLSNVVPGRIDTASNQRTGYHDSYQDQKRYKPQVYVALSYFKDGWQGIARLQGRLRLEARPPLLHQPQPGQHLLPRPQRQRERARAVQLAERPRRTTWSTTPGTSATPGSSRTA